MPKFIDDDKVTVQPIAATTGGLNVHIHKLRFVEGPPHVHCHIFDREDVIEGVDRVKETLYLLMTGGYDVVILPMEKEYVGMLDFMMLRENATEQEIMDRY